MSVRGVVGTLLVFAAAALCVRLGVWQLDRLHQRRVRNAAVQQRMQLPPVDLTTAPRDSSGWLQRRVVIRGRFDNARSIVWAGHLYQDVPGAYVLTPVLLSDSDAVLVNRGWVGAADGATVNIPSLNLAAEAADTGLIQAFPRNVGSPAKQDSSFRTVWFAIDAAAIKAQFPYRLSTFQVRLLPSAKAAAVPTREPPPVLDEGPHLGYAIQWFSFAIIALVGWAILVRQQNASNSNQS